MENKIKVLLLSKVFPKGHPRVGKPTLFKDKIFIVENLTYPSVWSPDGCKIHTIRNTSDWIMVSEKINMGKMVLSVRQWSGIPYKSIHDDEIFQLCKIGIQKITIANRVSEYQCYVDGLLTDITTIAQNDGLSKQDFIDWFKPYFKKGDMLWNGVIIHFTDFRYQ